MAGRALIIDKDAAFAERLEAALQGHGLEVETRATGRDGIEQARATHPDLIVLCVELDDTSGYSICAKIKKDPELKAIPLVITSEKATQETFDHHKKLKTRAQVYLMKPFEPEALVEEVRTHVAALGSSNGGAHLTPAEIGEIQIEEVDVEAATSADIERVPLDPPISGDIDGEVVAPDTGAELDEAIASLSDQAPPLPDDEYGIEGSVGLRESYDEDEVRTTIGKMPSSSGTGSIDLPPQELLRRLKEAERARDEAVASERSVQAQLQALAAGASQLPAASSASREVLVIKKELNAKEREVLELRDQLQERDRQLLDARDREAELEERVVQTEEARAQADRARVEAESKIAGAEARAEEIDRSSKAAIADLDEQVDAARNRIEELEQALSIAKGEAEDLRGVVAEREATISEWEARATELEETIADRDRQLADRERQIADRDQQIGDRDQKIQERDTALAGRDARIGELEGTLSERESELASTTDELQRAREQIEGLTARADGLDAELGETRGEAEALREALTDTEERLSDAVQRIREDEDIRSRARQAVEITLNLLSSADYGGESSAQGDEGGTPMDDAMPS